MFHNLNKYNFVLTASRFTVFLCLIASVFIFHNSFAAPRKPMIKRTGKSHRAGGTFNNTSHRRLVIRVLIIMFIVWIR